MKKEFILISLILIIILAICINQFLSYPNEYKYVYILILFLTTVAVCYETQYSGCSFYDCSDNTVVKTINNDNLACKENNRVNWRRAIIFSFIILTIINIINNDYKRNLIIFLILFFLLYFYFNFEQYHRFRLLCKEK